MGGKLQILTEQLNCDFNLGDFLLLGYSIPFLSFNCCHLFFSLYGLQPYDNPCNVHACLILEISVCTSFSKCSIPSLVVGMGPT